MRRAQFIHCLKSDRLDQSGGVARALCSQRLGTSDIFRERPVFLRVLNVVDAGSTATVDPDSSRLLGDIIGVQNVILGVTVNLCAACRRLAPLTDDVCVALTDIHQNIETSRGDAVVCLDAWEERREFLKPDRSLRLLSVSEQQGANLNKIDTMVVLTHAVAAHRIANPKSRGDRLFISNKHGHVRCRFCEARLESAAQLKKDHDHVVRCALRYLIGMKPEGNIDA